jgi:predicted enzyme related to lactoylglutathione lyase
MGWTAADSGMPGQAYTLFSAGPTMICGLMPIPDESAKAGVPPAWMGYVGVYDVDAYAKKVIAAGGTLHKGPKDIPGIGRFAVVGDPDGAGFILFQPGSDQSPTPIAPDTPGQIGWHELRAGDLDRAFAFYSGLFGWTKAQAVDMGPMGTYQTFSTGGEPIGGMMTKFPRMPSAHWLYYFNVDGADAARDRVIANGGRALGEPHQVPGGNWIVHCADPQGAMFAVTSTTR